MIRLLRIALVGVVALYTLAVGALYLAQNRLLYPGAGGQPVTAAEAGLEGFQDLVIETPDGERLAAWWKPPRPGKAVIVYFHGNGGGLGRRRERARLLTGEGRGLLMVAYRGYPGSTGAPSEEGLRIDARAAYDFVARPYEPERIVLYGESLGTGVAVRLATEKPVAALVLDAPYTTTAAVAADRYPFVPVSLLMRDQFRSVDIIGSVKVPILVMHGTADRVIPFRYGEALFAAAPEPKRFFKVDGGAHSNLLERGGLAVLDELLKPVEVALPKPPEASAQ